MTAGSVRGSTALALLVAIGCRADDTDPSDTSGWDDDEVSEHARLETDLPPGESKIVEVTACCALARVGAPELCGDVYGSGSFGGGDPHRLDLSLDLRSIMPGDAVEIAARVTQPGLPTWTVTTGATSEPREDAVSMSLEFEDADAFPCESPATVELLRIDAGASPVELTLVGTTTGALQTAGFEDVSITE